MATQSAEMLVYDENEKRPLGKIVLNGYNFSATGPLGAQGTMHSFSIADGNLYDAWNVQRTILLQHEDGRQSPIKIAALPVEEDGFGLLQFV